MSSEHRRPRMSFVQGVARALWGYDFFISYQWATGGAYAVSLAEKLRERGFECFLDRAEFAGGDRWREEARNALRRTHRLVVVANREAIETSNPVAQEIALFTQRRRHVVLIAFGQPFSTADRGTLPVLANIPEDNLAIVETAPIEEGRPSDGVLDRLQQTHTLLRRRRLRATVVLAGFVVLATLFTVALVQELRTLRARSAELAARTEREQEALRERDAGLVAIARGQMAPLRAALVLREATAESDAWRETAIATLRRRVPRAVLRGLPANQNSRQVPAYRDELRFSPDGSKVISALLQDDVVRIWDVERGGSPRVLDGTFMSFSPDGDRILTASNGMVLVWDLDRERPFALAGHMGKIVSAAFSPDGARVVSVGDDHCARVWSRDGHSISIIGGEFVRAVFAGDGTRVLTFSSDGIARVWRVDGARLIAEQRTLLSADNLVVSRDGRRFAIRYIDDLELWRVDGAGRLHLTRRGKVSRAVNVGALGFNKDGSKLLIVPHEELTGYVWDTDGTNTLPLRADGQVLEDATFDHSGTRVAVASRDAVVVFSADGKRTLLPTSPHDWITHVVFSGDDTQVAGISFDSSTAHVWDTNGIEPPIELTSTDDHALSVSFDRSGARLVISSAEGPAAVWELRGGYPVVLANGESFDPTYAFDAGSSRLVTISDLAPCDPHLSGSHCQKARVWDVTGTEPPRELPADHVISAAFSPKDEVVLSVLDDGRAMLWPIDLARPPVAFGPSAGVAFARFSPDGSKILVTSRDGDASLWAADGTELHISFRYRHDWIERADYSDDGTKVITRARGQIARIWSATGKGTPIEFDYCCTESDLIAFSPDASSVIAQAARQPQPRNVDGDRMQNVVEGPTALWRTDRSSRPISLGESYDWDRFGGVAFSPSGTTVVTVHGGLVEIRETSGSGTPRVLARNGSGAAAFSRDGSRLLLGTDRGDVLILDDGGRVQRFRLEHPIQLAAFSPDASTLAVRSGNAISIWDLDLRAALWFNAPHCLTAAERSDVLGETDADARRRATACEQDLLRVTACLAEHRHDRAARRTCVTPARRP